MMGKNQYLRLGYHFLFWGLFLVYRLSTTITEQSLVGDYWWGDEKILVLLWVEVLFKALFAYGLIYFLVPKFLDTRNYLFFGMATLGWLYLVYTWYVAAHFYYLEHIYDIYMSWNNQLMSSMYQRLTTLGFLLSTFSNFLFPAIILGAIKFYKRKMLLSKVEEEKNKMELKALRNQLNPHFLFNTLNNLYTLALKKDDRTPDVISTLSSILDHILYKSNQHWVPLAQEVKLLQDYINLERLRYGSDRLKLTFERKGEINPPIAPLILLTLIENAFKHGVKNEIDQAEIKLALSTDEKQINFSISNTKPKARELKEEKSSKIGLENIRKQLNLIYPNRHNIHISDEAYSYQVDLQIIHKDA